MNKKRLLGIILSIILVLGLTPVVGMTARADVSLNGSGTEQDPYKIGTKEQLKEFRDIVNNTNNAVCAVLTADIDLGGSDSNRWTPIGANDFSGVFDGQGHAISNLYVKEVGDDAFGGLFSLSHGKIKNLRLSGYVSGVTFAGGIVGCIYDGGRIENCHADVTVEVSISTNISLAAGGIVGVVVLSNPSNNVIISNCSSSGTISASTTNSEKDVYAGGIFGAGQGLSVTYCYSKSNVTATKNSVIAMPGGIAGRSENATITSCYYNTTTAGDSVAKAVGNSENTETVKGLTADECKDKSKFVGFDFINNWFISADGPKLWATDSVSVSTWSDLHDALALGGNIKLTANVTYGTGDGTNENTELVVPSGVTVTLDLAGHTVNRNVGDTAVPRGYVINVEGNLTLNDSGTDGKLTGGNTAGNGGGVYVDGTFTMNGGTICGNSTKQIGGGVCFNSGRFTMNGGTITDNVAYIGAGGVFIGEHQNFQISGSATVTGNKKIVGTVVSVNNIILQNNILGDIINVAGTLTGSIGVTMQTPGVFTSGLSGKGTAANFTSDDAAYAVGLTEAGEATLGYAVTLTAGTGMTKTSGDEAQFILPDSSMGDIVYTANDGYYFPTDYASLGTTTGITVVRDSDTQITVSGTPTASATLALAGATAKSKPSPTPVTPSASVKTAPVANTLTYSERPQELVTAGEAKGGTMQYALGKSKSSIPTSGWSESIPTGTDAGTYFVWYKAKGDSSHTNSVPKCVTVTIEKITSSVTTEPTVEIKTLISSGELQELITAGEAAGGTVSAT